MTSPQRAEGRPSRALRAGKEWAASGSRCGLVLNVDNPRRVSSPTFSLIHEYAGRLPIYHFDTYRLPSVQAFVDLGVEEYFAGDGVCLIEWADRVAEVLPMQRLEVRIEVTGETTRRAAVTGVGPRQEAIVRSLGDAAV